jgi:hypothetical protein
MIAMRTMVLVLAAASVALSAPRTATACSLPACTQGFLVPGGRGVEVPANIPAVYWRPMRSYEAFSDPVNVVLANAADPKTSLAFTVQPADHGDFLLVPSAPLVAGQRYLVSDHNECEQTQSPGPEVAFAVGPAVAMPSELGTLVVTSAGIERAGLANYDSTCSSDAIVAQASIQLEPAASAIPWMNALHFETLVDGEPWSFRNIVWEVPAPGASPLGRGRDRVFERCDADHLSPTQTTGLARGKHVVTMRATLPGTGQVITSSPLEVSLDCAAQPDTQLDPEPSAGGCNAGGSGAPLWLAAALLALRSRSRRLAPERSNGAASQ